jgi:hypothetical protein
LAHSLPPLAALRLQATPERLAGLALRPPLLETSLRLLAAQAAPELAQLLVVAAALLVLFMELVVPVVLRLAAQLTARAVVDLVPAELEAASQAELIRQAAEAGLISPGGLAITAVAAVAAVELWGPVVSPIAVGVLGVPDTLKRQLLYIQIWFSQHNFMQP